jgi:hypothetical protein
MAIQIEAARMLVYQGAWRGDQGLFGREHAEYLAIAKAHGAAMEKSPCRRNSLTPTGSSLPMAGHR